MKVQIWDNQTSDIGVPYGELVEPISHPPEFNERDQAMRARDEMIYQALKDQLGSGPVRIKVVEIPVVECMSARGRRMDLSLAYFKYIKADTHRRNVIATPTHLHENLVVRHYVQGGFIIPESSRAHANNINRFRSVCTTGIILTLIFGGCIGYLTNRNYIMFEVGTPILFGLSGILIGFLDGLRRNK